jgi:hypothetical protein
MLYHLSHSTSLHNLLLKDNNELDFVDVMAHQFVEKEIHRV